MDFNELKGWITLLIAIGGVGYNLITRLNHVKHIQDELVEIKKKLHEIESKVEENVKDISYMKGRTNGRK